MKKHKLTYHFHDPNSPEKAADFILKIFIESNRTKVEASLQEALNESETIFSKLEENT